jgi:hypothetical protein
MVAPFRNVSKSSGRSLLLLNKVFGLLLFFESGRSIENVELTLSREIQSLKKPQSSCKRGGPSHRERVRLNRTMQNRRSEEAPS